MSNNQLLQKFLRHVEVSGKPKALLIDFFDTVVGRTIEPEYVKAIWAKQLKCRLDLATPCAVLHAKRVETEALLCQSNRHSGFDDEFRYLDMATVLYAWLVKLESLPVWCTESVFTRVCEDIELAVEKRAQFLYLETADLLKHACRENVPVYLVSDTFLPVRLLRQLFEWWGIRPFFRDIFLSSDALLAKRSGRLFGRVLQTLRLSGAETVMIGDNPISDLQNASAYDIRAIHVQHEHPLPRLLGERDSRRKAVAHLSPSLTAPHQLFPEFASSMLLFISKLYRRVLRADLEDLLFCSREGLLLKRLFDAYQDSVLVEKRVRTHYYYTSRVASFLPGLKPLDDEAFHTLFRQYRRLSLRQFLLNLQMSEANVAGIADALNQDPREVIDDFPSSSLFERLKDLKFFREVYEQSRVAQRSCALEYLRSFFPDTELPSKIALVDIGWKGTIQDNIRALLPADCSLEGFYVGLVAEGSLSPINKKEGLLFSSVPTRSTYFEAFAETCPLFEIFLSAQHAGTISYERVEGGVRPVFGVDDCNDTIKGIIEQVQSNIYTLFTELLQIFAQSHTDEIEYLECIAKRHSRIGFAPSHEELSLVASIEHHENFGLFDHTSFGIPKQTDLRRVAKSFIQYMRDPAPILNSSLWPALSLHREGLSTLLPYYAKRRTKEIFGVG